MRRTISIFVLLSSAVWADEPDRADAVKADLQKLQGTWDGYVVEGKGENPDRGPVHLLLTITETEISAFDLDNDNRAMGSGTYKIDPTKTLKAIDATGVILPGRRKRTYPGIYEVDDNILRWCVDNRRKDRPTEFRTTGGKYLLFLKRKKSAAGQP